MIKNQKIKRVPNQQKQKKKMIKNQKIKKMLNHPRMVSNTRAQKLMMESQPYFKPVPLMPESLFLLI